MRDVTRTHEKADRLRNFRPVGDYEAIYFDEAANRYRNLGEVQDYFTNRDGQSMVMVLKGGFHKFIKVQDITLVAPGL